MTFTLLDVASEIADDLARDDLTTQIRTGIRSAVRRYEGERFSFNEFYRVTATLSSGAQTIAWTQLGIEPLRLDRVAIYRSSGAYVDLEKVGARELEDMRDLPLSSEPGYYAIEGNAVAFDCSAASNYTVVFDGIKKISSASADADTSAWFNEARDLIRATVKKSLYLHVIKEPDQAQACAAAEAEALAMLRAKTTSKRATGYVRPHW